MEAICLMKPPEMSVEAYRWLALNLRVTPCGGGNGVEDESDEDEKEKNSDDEKAEINNGDKVGFDDSDDDVDDDTDDDADDNDEKVDINRNYND